MSETTIKQLIERLERAEGPAYALDCAIADFLSGPDEWILGAPPAYTGLVDKAITLVPRHHLWMLKKGIECQAVVWMLETDYDERQPPTGYTTEFPALALCIAALKARQDHERHAHADGET